LKALALHLANDAVRVVVLRSEGKDFCAGADLHAIRGMLDEPLQVHLEDAQALGNVFLGLATSAKPTVALVRGLALAGGAALATSCDMVIAHDDALFGYPEVALGFVPAIAMTFLVRSVGEKVAFDLLATGRVISSTEALQIGLVSRRYGEDEFEREAARTVALLAQASTSALLATRKLLRKIRTLDIQQGVAEGVTVNAAARLTDDFRKGVIRFSRKGESR
jgi:methylglutaconyl-CoA hydratase